MAGNKKQTWYSIDTNKMLRDEFNGLKRSLKGKGAKFDIYESNSGSNRLYLGIDNETKSVSDMMSQVCYYSPISQLSKAPKIGDPFRN